VQTHLMLSPSRPSAIPGTASGSMRPFRVFVTSFGRKRRAVGSPQLFQAPGGPLSPIPEDDGSSTCSPASKRRKAAKPTREAPPGAPQTALPSTASTLPSQLVENVLLRLRAPLTSSQVASLPQRQPQIKAPVAVQLHRLWAASREEVSSKVSSEEAVEANGTGCGSSTPPRTRPSPGFEDAGGFERTPPRVEPKAPREATLLRRRRQRQEPRTWGSLKEEDKAARASLRMERSAAPAASGERHGSRALDALCKGDVMSKLVAAKGTWQERFVCLFPAPPAVPTALRWSSDVRGRKLSRRSTSVPLTEVLRIGFGDEQLPASIRMKVKPWHCFSLWTAKRSFLFWAPQAETAEAFIVGLSRLCKHLSFGQGQKDILRHGSDTKHCKDCIALVFKIDSSTCYPSTKQCEQPTPAQLLVESRWMTLRLTTVVALARASQAAYFPGPAEHLWIDADPSGLVWTGLDCDDDLALLAALALNASAEIHLEGLSICGGNVLTWKGEDSDAAAKAIIAAAAAAPPRSLTILMLGPVTNLARALVLAPWLAQRLRHAVLMGGELTGQRLDLNFMTDRAAARAVISNALLPTTLVPIQTCAQVTVTPAFVERLERTCCPGAGVCAVGPKMWQQTFVMPWMVNPHVKKRMLPEGRWLASKGLDEGFIPWDVVALLAAVRPALFEDWEYLAVELPPCEGGEPCNGTMTTSKAQALPQDTESWASGLVLVPQRIRDEGQLLEAMLELFCAVPAVTPIPKSALLWGFLTPLALVALAALPLALAGACVCKLCRARRHLTLKEQSTRRTKQS
ncbi:unnamed protein product, partial [Polarella glacialis]